MSKSSNIKKHTIILILIITFFYKLPSLLTNLKSRMSLGLLVRIAYLRIAIAY